MAGKIVQALMVKQVNGSHGFRVSALLHPE